MTYAVQVFSISVLQLVLIAVFLVFLSGLEIFRGKFQISQLPCYVMFFYFDCPIFVG